MYIILHIYLFFVHCQMEKYSHLRQTFYKYQGIKTMSGLNCRKLLSSTWCFSNFIEHDNFWISLRAYPCHKHNFICLKKFCLNSKNNRMSVKVLPCQRMTLVISNFFFLQWTKLCSNLENVSVFILQKNADTFV